MHHGESLSCGTVIRLTTPYLNSHRGIYTVIYVYSNGWYGLLSHDKGLSYDVPAYICRPVETKDGQPASGKRKR